MAVGTLSSIYGRDIELAGTWVISESLHSVYLETSNTGTDLFDLNWRGDWYYYMTDIERQSLKIMFDTKTFDKDIFQKINFKNQHGYQIRY